MTKILAAAIIVLLVIISLILVSKKLQNSKTPGTAGIAGTQNEEVSKYKTVTSSESGIEVEVTPLNVSKSGTDFKVRITTHSESLDFDLLKKAKLVVEKQELPPLSWDGGSGGHHLFGTLKFPPVTTNVKLIKLVITGVGVPERNFEWNI